MERREVRSRHLAHAREDGEATAALDRDGRAHVEAESGSQWQSIHMFFSPADMYFCIQRYGLNMDMVMGTDMAWLVFSPATPEVEVERVQVYVAVRAMPS